MARPSHPGPEVLTRLAQGLLEPDAASEVRSHLAGCARCRDELESITAMLRAGRVRRWEDPPSVVTDRAGHLPGEPPAPGGDDAPAEVVSLIPTDVRGSGTAAAGYGQSVSRAVEGAELAVAVFPPGPRGLEHIQGRVWLDDADGDAADAADRAIDVLVVIGDHVIDRAQVRSGEVVDLQVVPGAWRLEVHLPDGRMVVVERPVP